MNKLFTLTTSAALSLLLASCASNLTAVKTAPIHVTSVSERDRAIAERIYSLINSIREGEGKKRLAAHQGLNNMIQQHSAHNARSIVSEVGSLHVGSAIGSLDDHGSINRAQYAYLKYSIENLSELTHVVLAGSNDPAADAVDAWMSNPKHSNYLLQSWDLTGIGVYTVASGEIYVKICVGAQPMGVPRAIRPIGWQ